MQKRNSSNFSKIAFIALFGAMALTAFRLVSKPTNLLQGVLAPLPQASLLVGSPPNSQNDEPGDVAKFFAIEWTTNGVEMVLHRPPALAVDALEVTLVGSTNLVTATWEPFMNVTFPAGDTNVSVTVSSAMLDAHSVSNACFFAFINSGDSDADGLFDWDERFNFKTDPYDAFSVMGALESSGVATGLGQAYKDIFAVKFGGHSPEEVLGDGHTVYEHALYTGTWNGELPSDLVLGSGDVQVTLSIDKRRCPDASTLRIGDIAIPLVPDSESTVTIAIPSYTGLPISHERDTDDNYDYYQFLDGIVEFECDNACLLRFSSVDIPGDAVKAYTFPTRPVCIHDLSALHFHSVLDGVLFDSTCEVFDPARRLECLRPDGSPCGDMSAVHRQVGHDPFFAVDLDLSFPPDETRLLRFSYVSDHGHLAGPTHADIEVHYCPRPEWLCDCAGHGADGLPSWMVLPSPCTCNGLIDSGDWDGDGIWNGYDPHPRNYTWASSYDQNAGIWHWTVWDQATRFANPPPGSSAGAVVFERTFFLDRRSRWEQFFLSTDLGGSGGLDLAGATLEWEDDGGARGSTTSLPTGDSMRLQLSPSARTLTMRLRTQEDNAFTRPAQPLYILSYMPEVQIAGNWIADDETTYNRYLVLADGADSAVPISVDRSARPCHAALSAEESDVGALLQEFYEQAFIDFEIHNQQFYSQQLSNPFADGAEVVYDSQGIDATTQTEHGEFRLPPGNVYPLPPDGTLPSPVGGSGLILVLDPVMMCDDGTCADAVRLVHDPDGGTYSLDDGYPFDTACLRRGYASGEDGSSPFAEPTIDPGVGGIPFDVVSWWTDTVDGCHTGAVSVCGHEVWWAGHEAHHASCRDFAPTDPLSDRCGCCADGCANGNCDALESPEGGRRLRIRIPFGQPRKGQVSGFFFMDADGPLSVAPGVFQTAMRGGGVLEGTPGVDAENRPETVYACDGERGRDIHVRQDGNGVLLTVRDHATGRLEHTWQIGNVDGSSSRVRFRQISRLGNPMQDATFDWDASKGSWSKSDGISGLREEVEVDDRLSDDGSPTLVETRTRSDAEGTFLVRTVREWSRLGSASRAVLREVRRREQRFDPGAGEWIDVNESTADYWGEEACAAKFGKARLVSGSDRAWEFHDYDGEGREVLRVEQRNGSSVPDSFPWLDGDGALQIPLGFGDAFVTVFDYAPHAGDAGAADDADLPRTETRYAVKDGNATLTARTWRRYTHPTSSGIPCVKCETWRAASQDASFGDAGNAQSYTVVYDEYAAGVPLAARGENAESLDEDGIRTVRACSQSPGRVVFTERRYKGDVEFPTYAVTELDATHGTPLRTATYVRQSVIGPDPVDNPSSADVLVDQEVNIYDEKNRLRSTTYLDGSVATNHYSCCRLLDRTDREGRKTLRSAVTGQDRLYYAEEDVYLGEISSGGGHRVTQHFLDVLGRETNTTTYVETTPGAAVDRDASAGHEVAVRETFYPRGTDDLVVRVDERGKTTTAETAGTQAGTTTTETVSTNGVVVTTTTTTSLRGGATTTRTVWDGGWTESRVEEDYAADGCRVVRRYRGASDMQEFLAETSTYDFLGRLVSSSRPGMNDGTVTTTTAYDGVSSRRVSSSTTGSPAVSYAYDQLGELATTTCDGVSQTVATSYEWDADDDELYKVERTWRTIPSMFVDSVRTRETRTRLTGLSVYDLISYRTATGEDGLTAEETIWSICEYDDRYQPIFTGRIVSARRTGQGTEDLSLDRYGFTLSTQGIDGWTDSCLDGLGRETQVDVYRDEINDHSQTIRQYDLSGKVVASMVSASVSSLTLFVYDAFGRETMRSEGGSGSQRIFATGYDALGRPVYMGGDRHPVKIGYDAEGRKVSSRTTRDDGANWDETSWEFDSATGVNTSKTYADQSNVGHTYTVDGKPVRTTWARGSWKERSYDLSGRLSGIAYSASSTPSVALSYICLDRISSATVNGVCTVSYGYDERELCVEEEMEIGTDDGFVLSRSYDLNRRPVTTSVANTTWYSAAPPFAAMTRSYDSENRVSGYDLGGGSVAVSVEYDGSRQTGLVYTLPCNAGTFRVSLTRQSGRPDWITGRAYAFGNESPVYQHQTTYDCLGRPTSIVDSRFGTRRWLYNRRSEVVGTSGDAQYPYDFSYSYDSIGNRMLATENGVSSTYAANSLSQYTAVNRTIEQSEQSNNFTYDADGNLTQDDRFTYAYDCENRLVSVTPTNPVYGSRAIENVYDHRNRRIKKIVKSFDGTSWNMVETHVFIWDGWNILLEKIAFADNATRTIEYFWGNDLSGTEQGAGGVGGLLATRIDGVFYVPCYGSNGNIMMYVDEMGAVAAQYDYDPYGNILQALGPLAQQFAFGFSTKYHDREVGLVAYQLRTYNPGHGRWISQAPTEDFYSEILCDLALVCGLEMMNNITTTASFSIANLGLNNYASEEGDINTCVYFLNNPQVSNSSGPNVSHKTSWVLVDSWHEAHSWNCIEWTTITDKKAGGTKDKYIEHFQRYAFKGKNISEAAVQGFSYSIPNRLHMDDDPKSCWCLVMDVSLFNKSEGKKTQYKLRIKVVTLDQHPTCCPKPENHQKQFEGTTFEIGPF